MHCRILVALLLTLSAWGVLVPSAGAATRFVAPNGSDEGANNCSAPGNPCQTVQRAVDAAEVGDTVSVEAGIYQEELRVNKALRIEGQGSSTLIEGPATKPALSALSDLTLESLLIRGGQTGFVGAPAIVIGAHGANVSINAVVAEQASLATEGRSTVDVVGGDDVLTVNASSMTGVGGAVLSVIGSSTATVIGSAITASPSKRSGKGIEVGGSTLNLIRSNISNNGARGPVVFSGSGIVNASDSTFTGNELGIWASGGSVTLTRDLIRASEVGLLQQEGATLVVRDSLVSPVPGGALPTDVLVNPSVAPAALTIVGSTLYAEGVNRFLNGPRAIEVGPQEGAVQARIANSILRAAGTGGAVEIADASTGATWSITHSAFTHVGFGLSLPEPGAGTNVAAVPVFADQLVGDYRLTEANTQLLDAGDPAEVTPGETDLAGQPRALPKSCEGIGAPDVGAYELTPPRSCLAPPSGRNDGGGQKDENPQSNIASRRTTKPVLTGVKVKRGSKGPRLEFTLSLPAKVKVAIVRVVRRKVGKHERKFYAPVATFTDEASKGSQSIPLTTRLGSGGLPSGLFRLTVVASADGLKSAIHRVSLSLG